MAKADMRHRRNVMMMHKVPVYMILFAALMILILMVGLSVHKYMFPPRMSESRVASDREKGRIRHHGIENLTPAPVCEAGGRCYFVREGKRIRL
jgi:hypothetical protein